MKLITLNTNNTTYQIGVNDEGWKNAVMEQLNKIQHTSNLYYTAPCGKLAKKLCKRTGMSKVFFGNSGAEANEGAIKAARKYSFDHYGKGRDVVITLVNSFHGRTPFSPACRRVQYSRGWRCAAALPPVC